MSEHIGGHLDIRLGAPGEQSILIPIGAPIRAPHLGRQSVGADEGECDAATPPQTEARAMPLHLRHEGEGDAATPPLRLPKN